MALICYIGCITMGLLCVTCLSLKTPYQHRLASEFEAADVPADKMEMLIDAFAAVDTNQNGFTSSDEIEDLFQKIHVPVPNYKIRILMQRLDDDKNHKLSPAEFAKIYTEPTENDTAEKLRKAIAIHGKIVKSGASSSSVQGPQDSYSEAEAVAFTNWISEQLADDPDIGGKVGGMTSDDLFRNAKDGVVFCKLINNAQTDTIDGRTINIKDLNIYRMKENANLAINSAASIGCNVVNIGVQDIAEGKPHLILDLLWQILRVGLLAKIDLTQTPDLGSMLKEGERLVDFEKLSPEELLLRWMNYHLANSKGYIAKCGGTAKKITNFNSDIKDSIAYCYLLEQIQPADLRPRISGNADCSPATALNRAEAMLESADRLGCRDFVTPNDVIKGREKLNLAFVANLFNTLPALSEVDFDEEIVVETTEMKTYRNWMNSLGVSPRVNHILKDLQDGLVLLQLFGKFEGVDVDWEKVNQPPYPKNGGSREMLENCNYAVQLGKNLGLNMTGIDGEDLRNGDKSPTLQIVWQILRAYTEQLLNGFSRDRKAITDADIVAWVNSKLEESGKESRITSLEDPSIATSRAVIDLIDAVKPGSINYDVVTPGKSNKGKMSNARYAASMTRKIGAAGFAYAQPEDLEDVNPKTLFTVFACLMARSSDRAH